MDIKQKEKWLDTISRVHGQAMSNACRSILAAEEDKGVKNPSLFVVLQRAEEKIYKKQIDAAVLAGDRCLDSDADL